MKDPMIAPSPKTQAEVDLVNALRDYERIHKEWMNTPIWDNTERGTRIKSALAISRETYIKAVKSLHPDWVVM